MKIYPRAFVLVSAFSLVSLLATSALAVDAKTKAAPAGEAYPLAVCPISGEKLGSMGKPLVKMYDGREVRFCCKGCLPKFEKNLSASLAKLDEAIVKDQLPLYPVATSIVTGEKLGGQAVNWVYHNRLVRLANAGEQAAFIKDAAKFMTALDAVVIKAQLKTYPLTTCLSSGEKLDGEDMEAKNIVVGGRLIRLCCAGCVKDVMKDPAKFIAKVDAARKGEKAIKQAAEHAEHDHKKHNHADHDHGK